MAAKTGAARGTRVGGLTLALYFVFAGLIVALDRLVKLWASRALAGGGVIEPLPGVLRLTYVENTGAAFGMLADMRWLLVAVSTAAAIALIFVVWLYADGSGRLFASAILGGAIGNLIDRIATGRVVDIFEPLFVNFAVFNVADIFITLGGIAFVIHALLSAAPRRGARDSRRASDTELTDDAPDGDSAELTYEYSEEYDGELTEERILEEYYRDLQTEAERETER
ncbi:MAG: signal peptidase II [Oscillospiraceae bacterium]|jgi:signal peptidase II|nr:signal peptidase II [Oscillospiraceae bacterium]